MTTLRLRPRAIPQCSACLRSYDAFAVGNGATAFRQQVRGKKRLPNNSGSLPVRLLKDVKRYGRKGAVVPIAPGMMRNDWFPRRIAEYVVVPELKTLRRANVSMERDFEFGVSALVNGVTATDAWDRNSSAGITATDSAELRRASAFQKDAVVEKLSPDRSTELMEIFVPPRLDFYRQPIMEETKAVEPSAPAPTEQPVKRQRFARGAAADLLAARMPGPEAAKPNESKPEESGPVAIYGSVSTQDVLNHIRAAMGTNDEAARVVLQEGDVHFVDLPEVEGAEADRVKHAGDFAVEITVKGSEKSIRRAVRVIPQEA